VEGVIGVREEPVTRAGSERLAKRRKLIEHGKRVACTLQEQHRDLHVEEMLAAIRRRLAGGV